MDRNLATSLRIRIADDPANKGVVVAPGKIKNSKGVVVSMRNMDLVGCAIPEDEIPPDLIPSGNDSIQQEQPPRVVKAPAKARSARTGRKTKNDKQEMVSCSVKVGATRINVEYNNIYFGSNCIVLRSAGMPFTPEEYIPDEGEPVYEITVDGAVYTIGYPNLSFTDHEGLNNLIFLNLGGKNE